MLPPLYDNRPTCWIRRKEFYYLVEYNPNRLDDGTQNAIIIPGAVDQ